MTTHNCTSWNLSLLLVVQNKLPYVSICTGKHHQGRGNTLCWEQMQSLINWSSTLKFFLFYNLTCISQIFVRYLLKWSKLRYLKAEVLWVPQKVRTVLVRYLLSEISILIYSCNECGTSKIYSCLEDHHFPRQVIIFPGKFKTRN